ncbi:MAG: hypothetical protein AAFV98_23830, partial [Chloroflexota bacterium]
YRRRWVLMPNRRLRVGFSIHVALRMRIYYDFASMPSHETTSPKYSPNEIRQMEQDVAELEPTILLFLEVGLTIDEEMKLDEIQERRESILNELSKLTD